MVISLKDNLSQEIAIFFDNNSLVDISENLVKEIPPFKVLEKDF